jgi:chorismate synthase
MLRFLTAGESHGPSLSVIVEGLPSGLDVREEDLADELARRRLGYGRGPRMRFERDELRLIGGVRHGRTLGSPVAIEILNSEWPKWQEEMSAAAGTPTQETHRAPTRSRRPRRHAEVRLR